MWIASKGLSGSRVTINGVDSKRPTKVPFTWAWGDGSTTKGWFPQSHRYASTTAQRAFVLSLTSNEDDGSKDCAELAICFGTGQLKLWKESQSGDTIEFNGVDPRQPTQTAFTWIWGDGTRTTGWFPQSHDYAGSDRPYTITVIAAEDDGTSDCVQLTVPPSRRSNL